MYIDELKFKNNTSDIDLKKNASVLRGYNIKGCIKLRLFSPMTLKTPLPLRERNMSKILNVVMRRLRY